MFWLSKNTLQSEKFEKNYKTAILCALQCILLRGHIDNREFSLDKSPASNNGNLRAEVESMWHRKWQKWIGNGLCS